MSRFYIVPKSVYDSTDWQASENANLEPRKIKNGFYSGNYAINSCIIYKRTTKDKDGKKQTEFIARDPSFEKYVELFSTLEIAEISHENFL